MSLTGLLTGRQLVAELERLGVGIWTAAAVRQWANEEPPVPIAAPGVQGGPHRYDLAAVLNWLRARAEAERAKGYTPRGGMDIVSRIDAALARLIPATAEQPATPAMSKAQPQTTLPLLPPQGASAQPPVADGRAVAEPVAQAKPQHFTAAEVDGATEVDLLMQVLEGRDPRNWKAAEEALRIRNERLQAQKRWIPVDELQRALDAEAQAIASAIGAERQPLKMALRDCTTDAERDRVVDEAWDMVLSKLSRADDLGAAA